MADTYPFRRAVCAIDFSEHSRNALSLGLRLSTGPVQAVHVLDVPHYVHPRMFGFLGSEGARPLSEIARDEADRRLQTFVTGFGSDDERIEPRVLAGQPADTILRFAVEHAADAIFIGTQGEAPLSKRLLGRVANRVIRGARAAVVTVPPQGLRPIERVLVATDFSSTSEAALQLAAQLASATKAGLEVLHVSASPLMVPADMAVAADPLVGPTTPTYDSLTWLALTQRAARQEMDRLEDAAERRGIRIDRARVELGNPAAKVLETLESEPFQLVAVGTHGRRGLAHLMLGSVAESITHHAQVPVLIVHQAD